MNVTKTPFKSNFGKGLTIQKSLRIILTGNLRVYCFNQLYEKHNKTAIEWGEFC